jgi:hypothetical protein
MRNRITKDLVEFRKKWLIRMWDTDKNISKIVGAFNGITTDTAYKIIREIKSESHSKDWEKTKSRISREVILKVNKKFNK